MRAATLEHQIAVFERLLPKLRTEIGSKWAVIAGDAFIAGFDQFSTAAEFVERHHPEGEVLIRHTEAAPASIPFVAIED